MRTLKHFGLVAVAVLLVGCGARALRYHHPKTGKSITCDGGGAFGVLQRENHKALCSESAVAAGYEIEPDE
jgi:hypothetical protein